MIERCTVKHRCKTQFLNMTWVDCYQHQLCEHRKVCPSWKQTVCASWKQATKHRTGTQHAPELHKCVNSHTDSRTSNAGTFKARPMMKTKRRLRQNCRKLSSFARLSSPRPAELSPHKHPPATKDMRPNGRSPGLGQCPWRDTSLHCHACHPGC